MSDSFEKILQFTLQWEGGYVNDIHDPGGETRWGISNRAYPDLDIKNLTIEQAKEIYKRDYWDKVAKGEYDSLDMCAFDSAVNVGVARVKRWLVLNGTWHELLNVREAYYRNLVEKHDHFGRYLNGWFNRTRALREFLERG